MFKNYIHICTLYIISCSFLVNFETFYMSMWGLFSDGQRLRDKHGADDRKGIHNGSCSERGNYAAHT